MELSVHQINQRNKLLEADKKVKADLVFAGSREASIALIRAKATAQI